MLANTGRLFSGSDIHLPARKQNGCFLCSLSLNVRQNHVTAHCLAGRHCYGRGKWEWECRSQNKWRNIQLRQFYACHKREIRKCYRCVGAVPDCIRDPLLQARISPVPDTPSCLEPESACIHTTTRLEAAQSTAPLQLQASLTRSNLVLVLTPPVPAQMPAKRKAATGDFCMTPHTVCINPASSPMAAWFASSTMAAVPGKSNLGP